MAKSKAKAKTGTAKTETEGAKFGSIPANKLTALLRAAKKTKEKTAGLSGELGQMVANAVENDHLHRKAFSFTKQLHQMPDEKLAETMTHFLYYLDASGINARVEKVGRLELGDQPGESEAEETEQPEKSSNVHKLAAAE